VEGTLARSQKEAEAADLSTSPRGSNVRASRTSVFPITVTGSLTPCREVERAFDKRGVESIDRGLFPTRKALERFAENLESFGAPRNMDRTEICSCEFG